MYEKKLKVSISKGFIDKDVVKNKLAYKDGFVPHEITLSELADAIDQGLTFSYQFRDQIRGIDRFQASDILAIDIDYGMTLSEAFNHTIVKQFCSMIYTTVNHGLDLHRFRLIFVLPRTITNAKELSAATRALAQRLGGDRAATDAARMFHGCKDSKPNIFDHSIDDVFLSELIEDGLTIPVSESISFHDKTANRSNFRPEPSLLVKTSDGQQIKADSIKKLTQIHCPFHNDQNPSAFVNKNKKGSVYLYCPKCLKTWWLSNGNQTTTSFNNFEETVLAINSEELQTKNKASLISLFQDSELIRPDNIFVTRNKHLAIHKLKDGITFIKSPKGSGKTTFLVAALNNIFEKNTTIEGYKYLEEYEENIDSTIEESYYGDEKVLLIGHRQALIGELCQRLKLNCYLDDKDKNYADILRRRNRYGICLDSLWKVESQTYDVVVIDEVEQVLAHFFSATLGEKRYGIFQIFANIIRKAKKVIALDADLGWITFTTLTDLVKVTSAPQITKRTPKRLLPESLIPIQIYLNICTQSDRVIHMYPNVSQLIHKIKQDVISGARIFVCSNSKAKIKSLDASLKKFEEELGRNISRILITSENSRNKEVQNFIKNITNECLNYNVILCSPSLGTGIDISFDNESQEIDAVYGIFENQVSTHFEIDQQLARVRSPKEVHVWVSPVCYNFETEFEVVKQDYLSRNLMGVLSDGMSPFIPSTDIEYESFLKLAAMVISNQRASKNYFKNNFIRHKKAEGWIIDEVLINESLQAEGRIFFKHGKDITKEDGIQATLNARIMDRREYERIEAMLDDEDAVINADEWSGLYRTRLELFYREPISRDLLKRDCGGKYRKAVSLYEDFVTIGELSYKEFIKSRSKFANEKNKDILRKLFVDRAYQCVLIHGLLSTTPLFKENMFINQALFTKDDLINFVKASYHFKTYVGAQFEINTQRDIHLKPTQHLNRILGTIGLRHIIAKKTNVNGLKVYHYKLDGLSLLKIEDLVMRRGVLYKTGWEFIDKTYGFTYPDLDIDELELLFKSKGVRARKPLTL